MDPGLLLLAFGRLPAGSPGVASESLFGRLFVARALFPLSGKLSGGSQEAASEALIGTLFMARALFQVSGKLSGGSPEVISEGMFGGLFRPYGCKGPFSRFRPTGPAGDSRRGALWGCGICWAPGGAPALLVCAPGPRKCVSLKPQCGSRVPVCGASGVLLGRNSENLRLSEAHSRSICAQKGGKKAIQMGPKESPKSPQN